MSKARRFAEAQDRPRLSFHGVVQAEVTNEGDLKLSGKSLEFSEAAALQLRDWLTDTFDEPGGGEEKPQGVWVMHSQIYDAVFCERLPASMSDEDRGYLAKRICKRLGLGDGEG